jgi:hypothetical protein
MLFPPVLRRSSIRSGRWSFSPSTLRESNLNWVIDWCRQSNRPTNEITSQTDWDSAEPLDPLLICLWCARASFGDRLSDIRDEKIIKKFVILFFVLQAFDCAKVKNFFSWHFFSTLPSIQCVSVGWEGDSRTAKTENNHSSLLRACFAQEYIIKIIWRQAMFWCEEERKYLKNGNWMREKISARAIVCRFPLFG